MFPVPASPVLGGEGLLLAVCVDQALDELVDVARLGQLPFGQLVAQLGLGEALVALAGLVMSLPGLPALGEAGLACPLLVGLLAGGPLGRRRLSRTISPTDSALSHEVTGRPHPLDGEAAVDAYRALHEIEVPFNGRDQVDLRKPGKPASQGPRALRPEIGGLVHRAARSARRGAVLPGHARHVFSSHFVEYAYYIKQVRTKASGGPG